MTHVRLTDCERVNGFTRIRLPGKGKGGRWTSIPETLYREIHQEYGRGTWLFESWGGNPPDRGNVAHQLQHAGRRVGIDNFHAHLLRHSRATDMLKNKGVSLKAVIKFLGHANVATTTKMYDHNEVDYHELWRQDSI